MHACAAYGAVNWADRGNGQTAVTALTIIERRYHPPQTAKNWRIFPAAAHYLNVTDLERSHAELRAALILAGKEIRKLQYGRRSSPVLDKLRAVLQDARSVAKAERQKIRVVA